MMGAGSGMKDDTCNRQSRMYRGEERQEKITGVNKGQERHLLNGLFAEENCRDEVAA